MEPNRPEQPNDRTPSPAFEEARRRRADLHQALVALEESISSPASGRLEQWTADVTKHLNELVQTLREHVETTERVGGLYDDIRMRAPRLAPSISRLQEEHPELVQATMELVRRFESTPVGGDWELRDARDDVQRVLGKLVRHRQQGADLVWEAYNLDIGGLE
ncbi:MAG: hemerythrin domain-containing protein [Candidatus Velamenicoccus archaeovorus]